jgi:hypothetical protein
MVTVEGNGRKWLAGGPEAGAVSLREINGKKFLNFLQFYDSLASRWLADN